MTRLIPIVLCITLVTATVDAVASGEKVRRVSPGQIAWHFVVNRTGIQGAPPDVVGYISAIEGVNGPMFQDVPCPNPPMPDPDAPAPPPTIGCVENAFFTLRVRPFSGTPPTILLTADPNVSGAVLSDLVFDVYLDRTPNQTWGNLDSFSDGEPVATFRESDLQTASGGEFTPLGAFTLFSSKLIKSKHFYYHGQLISFRRLVPFGVTSTNFRAVDSSAAFGTAIAVGPRHSAARNHKHN